MGKLAPYWLDIDNGKYVSVPDRAALVLRIFQMADAGDGALTIAKAQRRIGACMAALEKPPSSSMGSDASAKNTC
jgi:hypothetical protein